MKKVKHRAFGNVLVERGCRWHWTQAVWLERKVEEARPLATW